MLLDECEVPAPEAAACLVFGPAATDFGLESLPFVADFPAPAFAALASTCERGVNTTGICPRSSVGRHGAAVADAPAVEDVPGVALGAADRERSTRGGAAEDEAFESELNTVLGGATLVSAERTWRSGTNGWSELQYPLGSLYFGCGMPCSKVESMEYRNCQSSGRIVAHL